MNASMPSRRRCTVKLAVHNLEQVVHNPVPAVSRAATPSSKVAITVSKATELAPAEDVPYEEV